MAARTSEDDREPGARPGAPASTPASGRDAGPRLDARTLLAGAREVLIAHEDEVYRLRLTANNKLILTK